MPKGKASSPEKIAKILKAYHKGATTEALAKKHGVSQRSIQKYIRDAAKAKKPAKRDKGKEALAKVKKLAKPKGKPGRPPGPTLKITDAELLRQREEGLSVTELAKQHGVTTKTVRRHLEKAQHPKKRAKPGQTLKSVTVVMGSSMMNADGILAALKERRWSPKSKQPRELIVKLLCTQKDVFTAVPKAQGGGRGMYVVNPAHREAKATVEEAPTGTTTRLLVQAVTTKNRKWKAMKKIWDLCEKQGVSAPPEVLEFFGNRPPGTDGTLVILADDNDLSPQQRKERVIYINAKKLPRGTKKIRIEF